MASEKKKNIEEKKASEVRWFVIALSLVSIIGFLNIVFESLFDWSFANYIETLWLTILGASLILQTSVDELREIKKNGLTSEYLGKITMIIIGTIAIIAGALSLPQANLQNATFLAVKGIISLLAIIFIILQTWLGEPKR